MSDVWSELQWRGLLAQSTDPVALRAALQAGPVVLYAGFDPTADSLHVGNLLPLLTLRRFQLGGHRPIAVVGGATGLVGDPSGRSSERTLQPVETVRAWVERLRDQIGVVLDLSEGPAAARVVDNLDWIGPLSALDLLRDVGKHFSVNALLAKESVASRLAGDGLSYTEFSYLVLQALDFLELYRRYGCTLQVGGSDQWGNITAGLDLIRRVTGAAAHALTFPLVTNASGEKFGKSVAGAVWLDPARTSPYAFYQFWLRTQDSDVGARLRQFTFATPEEVAELEREVAERPGARAAQRRLAEEVTTLVHGAAEVAKVRAASEALFGRGELRELDEPTLVAALEELPRVVLPRPGLPDVTDLLVAAGLAQGRNAARRLIREGGAYLNGRRLQDPEEVPGPQELLAGRLLVLRRGRRDLAVAEAAP